MPHRFSRLENRIRRGDESEDRVEIALEILKQDGRIHSYYRVRPFGELDTQGIDFQIYLTPFLIVNLQVKSSKAGRKEHQKHQRISTPCIVVGNKLEKCDDRQLAAEVMRILDCTLAQSSLTLRKKIAI